MIKVLHSPRRIRCKDCLAELEYEYSDIGREKEEDPVLHMTITTSFIRCPVCNNKVIIDKRGKDW